ncbi:unnamed protein product [Phaeothamnion confervicola]
MDTTDFRLQNEFQRDFPLVERPFATIGAQVGLAEEEVLRRYAALAATGHVSRIGVVFAPHAAGTSTLAAMSVPGSRLEEVAAVVNAQPETNHNYEREHHWNLWFVLTAPTGLAMDAAVARIERATGLPVLVLPMLEEFHIDLGFDLDGSHAHPRARPPVPARPPALTPRDRRLVAAVQGGFPLLERPYAAIAQSAGSTEPEVISALSLWLEKGIARRAGVVVRHRALGYEANAMVVWDVPQEDLPHVAPLIAAHPEVTLCYRRPRRLPGWPYDLFCMIHGRDRDEVLAVLARMRRDPALVGIPYDVLFSTRCFKQRGARYAEAA